MLYFKEGAKANPFSRKNIEAFIGTMESLGHHNLLSKVGISEEYAQRVLSRQIGTRHGNPYTILDLANEMKEAGIVSRATMAYDIRSTVGKYARDESVLRKANIFQPDNAAFRFSREFGSINESTPKLFSTLIDIEDLAKGGEITDDIIDYAVTDAKKWFFDYEDLTEFEKKYMKRYIPFYTWLRKNVALQLNLMMHYKNMYSLIPKAQRAAGMDIEGQLPEWVREEGGFPIEEREGGVVRSLIPDLPYGDVNLMPFKFSMTEAGIPIPHLGDREDLMRDVMSSVHPWLKTITEVRQVEGLPNAYNQFYQRDLGPDAIAPRAMRFIAANPQVAGILDGALRLTPWFKEGLMIRKDDQGRLRINSNVQRALENNFPILQRLGQVEQTASTIAPGIEKWIQKVTGFKGNDRNDFDKAFRVLSFLFGIRQKDLDTQQYESQEARNIYRAAERERKLKRRQSPGFSRRTREYKRQQQRRMRKLGL
jgi:hypothetical protein